MYGSGNAASKYREIVGNRMYGRGEKIVPISDEDAKTWVEQYCSVDTYIELFGEVEE